MKIIIAFHGVPGNGAAVLHLQSSSSEAESDSILYRTLIEFNITV